MKSIQHITVFMGSQNGDKTKYAHVAQQLGQQLANQQITMVYGGGREGLMGITARATMQAGGTVIGITPNNLAEDAIDATEITELIQVANMDQRKDLLIQKADALIALPGGFGTLEEVAQTISWAKINLHQKPIALMNIDGFYDPLWSWLESSVELGFVDAEDLKFVDSVASVDDAFAYFERYFDALNH